MQNKRRSLLLGSCIAGFLSSQAFAGTADFTATLTVFGGAGSGLPTTSVGIAASGNVSFASGGGSFTLPSGIFVSNATSPVGWTSNQGPNNSEVYTIRTITNSSNGSGFFAGTAGAGPYSGAMSTGTSLAFEFGFVPLPNVFGSLVVPVDIGSAGTAVAKAQALLVPVTVTVIAASWTTGTITIDDQTSAAPTATTATTGTAAGTNNLTAQGGSLSLVTPYLIRVRGGGVTENRAGYARLSVTFSNFAVPEVQLAWLLVAGGAAVFAGRRGRRD
jgi:hypothetical protein